MNDHKIPFSIYRGTKIKQRAKESAKYAFREVSFIVNLFHVFYQYQGEEYRSLYQGHFYIEVRYIEVSGSAMPTMTGS